jgi:serine/threonine protein phosphatase PrpC
MVNVLSVSEAGRNLDNEGSFAVERHPGDPGHWFCCVADGQGGRTGGAEAAQLACRAAIAAAIREPPRKLSIPSVWAELPCSVDQAVCRDPQAGLTTLVGFSIAQGRLAGASCGDSAVLLVAQGGRPWQLTAGQPKNPPVGSGAAPLRPFEAELVVPWSVMAISDGVWRYNRWEGVEEAMSAAHGQQLVERLQQQARLRGNGQFPDDFTLVLFEELA